MKTLGVLFVIALISFYEVPKMKKQNMKKELMLFSIVLFMATTITILKLNGINIPNPTEGLRRILSPIGLGIESYFSEKGK